jgi:antitoxin VapB
MPTARIFKSGNSQAIRLPKEFRFDVEQVEIFRRGDEVVLKKRSKNLGEAFSLLAAIPDDFMACGRRDALPQERGEL